MSYKFSIIIPHKNSPELLERCINSLPKRNDLQIIIVDDNSDESIVDFSRFPGIGNKNIKIIFNKYSLGAGHARNLGLEVAEGKWLLFADADDYYLNIDALFNKYSEVENVDIVYFNCKGESDKTNRCVKYNKIVKEYFFNSSIGDKRIRFNWWTPWNKMVKKSLVDTYNLRFEEVMSGNDAKFCLLAGYFADKIAVELDCYYISTIQQNSITLRKKTLDERIEQLKVMMKIWNFTVLVGAPDAEYKNNIISIPVIRGLLYDYGIKGVLLYVKQYFKEKMQKNIYHELDNKNV